ncbi:integrase, partial [Klebsiella oxytoca]
GISGGPVFVTRTGRPLDRSNIWHEMKGLCREAGVAETKVFPHNLRHLFAQAFYQVCRDVVKLADVLGHSSIETTRIYLLSTGTEHARQLDRLGLVT